MKIVKFKVLKLEDPRKTESELEVGAIYLGMLTTNQYMISFTDRAGVDWIFYVDDTCEIVL